jgi:hypothetical protein
MSTDVSEVRAASIIRAIMNWLDSRLLHSTEVFLVAAAIIFSVSDDLSFSASKSATIFSLASEVVTVLGLFLTQCADMESNFTAKINKAICACKRKKLWKRMRSS